MSDKKINEAFVEVLLSRIPKKNQLVDYIADALSIEKETAYRRLRNVTMFTFSEIAILARKLNFSVDEIIINAEKQVPISNMMLHSYFSEKGEATDEWKDQSYEHIVGLIQESDSEFGMALKNIPLPLLSPYVALSKFYKFKYEQHANNPSRAILFKEIKLQDTKENNFDNTNIIFQQISHTIYIWDRKIIPTIIDDINFFKSLGLMDNDDVLSLKNELIALMNELEETTAKGYFEATENKIDFYISDEDIDSTYVYFSSEKICLSAVISHLYYSIISHNNQSKCKEVKDWIASMKYNSTLISGTGGKERIQFFNKQREIISTL